MNQVILVGNVGSSECRFTNTGKCVCNFSVATSNRWMDKSTQQWKEETTWHKCVAWIKSELDAPKKGDKVFVEGSINVRSWDNKEGVKQHTTEIKVKTFFAAPKDQHLDTAPQAPVFKSDSKFNEDTIPF